MGIDKNIDLSAEHKATVVALLEEYLPGTTVWAYGSRVKWTSSDSSDLDLVVFATREQADHVAALREAFEESDLPFRVDLFAWDDVPESFRDGIRAERVELTAPGSRTQAAPAWPVLRFEQLLTGPVRNGIYKRKEFHGRGAKIVNMGEIFRYPRLRAVPMRRVELSARETSRSSVRIGDLLFARRSLVAEGAGKCSVVIDIDELTAFESSLIRARPDARLSDSLYLYYFFNSPSGLHRLDTIRRQVAVAGITGRDLAKIEFPVPPLSEQRAIARILGALDDRIELNCRMNHTSDAMARALFRSWFVDFDPVRAKMEGHDPGLPSEIADLFPDRLVESELGDVPEGWDVVPLDTIAVFRNGLALQRFRPKADEEWLPVLKIAQLRRGATDAVERARASIASDFIVDDGDIVFSWSGSLELRIWTGGKAALNQHLFKVTSGSYPRWLVFRSVESHLRAFRAIAAGKATTMGHIKREHLREALCVVPHRDLLAAVSRVFERLEEITIRQSVASRGLHALRATLLPKLVSGDVRLPAALVSEAA